MTKAAIALDGNIVSEHFGKVREFLFVTFENGREISREVLPAPAADHAPGVFPNWVRSMGADVVMAGGMGVKAKQFFETLGVQVLTVPPMDVVEGVKALLLGTVRTVETDCGHGADHDCGHESGHHCGK